MPAAGARKYQALVNLSVPREGLAAATGQNDLVMKGDTVTLSETQARGFLNQNPPRIRLAAQANEPMPVIRPRDLTGRMFGPPSLARPDPAGATHIVVNEPQVPEATPPAIGSEDGQREVDALDIVPGTARVGV